jgi:DNA invertase Pin-like site-specific DNA recombinase
LRSAGCEKVFNEQVSSVSDTRVELERAIDFIREGDVLVVTKLDRLARSVSDALVLERRIAAKGAALRVLTGGLDTTTATGRLLFGVLASIAQFEREVMLERQREGIAAAKAAGKYKGRTPTVRRQLAEIRRLKADGLSNAAIARQLGCHRSNVARVLRAAPAPKIAEAAD